MKPARQTLADIAALPLDHPVRVLNMSGNQERVIAMSGMRAALPEQIKLLSGPGCAASICPEADLYQAIQLVEHHAVTLLVADNLLQVPLGGRSPTASSLAQAQSAGADVRIVTAPIEAVMLAQAEPQREMVFFAAGFETLMAPLAGMVLDGLPDNLSVLLCGRRVAPLLEELLHRPDPGFDAVLLPGNRCALIGTGDWERMSREYQVPAAVAGYTSSGILAAIHAVLKLHCSGQARVENCYQQVARPDGNAIALDHMDRVFSVAEGHWRGVGMVSNTAYGLRHAYACNDANHRYPDYREGYRGQAGEMPRGCECASVLMGHKRPQECRSFAVGCRADSPYGPCMAAEEGTCFVNERAELLN